eukprot:COSAG04_NODE_18122_length_450_cov_1.210826_1_plen_108_part_00
MTGACLCESRSAFNKKSPLPGPDTSEDDPSPYQAVRDAAIHWPGHPEPAPPGSVNVCPSAGSFVVMTENTTHGTMPVRAAAMSCHVLVPPCVPGSALNLSESAHSLP